MKKEVCVALVGGGYAGFLHVNGYKRVSDVKVRLKTLVEIDQQKAEAMRKTFGFEEVCYEFEDILNDPEIDLVDIVTPPVLHIPMAIQAIQAGKHVVCEKPLTGYFGRPEDSDPIGSVSKRKMYAVLLEEMSQLGELLARSDRKFMYAENWVYAPAIQKAAEILRAKKSKVLYFRGEESLRGSSSPAAGQWNKTGGGILLRNGAHPLGAILFLKATEARARGESFGVRDVMADTGVATAALSEAELGYINARPYDVEDYSALSLTFLDGTKALIISTDLALGGTQCYVNAYMNDMALECQLTQNNLMHSYFADDRDLDEVYLGEMIQSPLGWSNTFIVDEVIRGYMDELQNFALCAATGKEPISGFDLARLTTQVIYAGYLSAEEGCRVDLRDSN